jgi:hypothetical protein
MAAHYIYMEEVLTPVEERLGLAFKTFNSNIRAKVMRIEEEKLRSQKSLPAYGQIPHIDLCTGEIQIGVALTPSEPTIIYQGEQHYTLAQLASEVGIAIETLADSPEAAMRQLLLERNVLVDGMKPAGEGCMAVGDVIAMRGGVVHARPK